MAVKLFVFGFPYETQVVNLIELFTIYGLVHSITIPTDKKSGNSLNYGFIEMTDKTGADRAIEAINGSTFQGKTITVKLADQKAYTRSPAPKFSGKKAATGKNNSR